MFSNHPHRAPHATTPHPVEAAGAAAGDNLGTGSLQAPPPPGTNRVELTVGGHTVAVESAQPLADVVSSVLGIYECTKTADKTVSFGFEATGAGGQFERAEPYAEPGDPLQRWEETAVIPRRDGKTRRLDIGIAAARRVAAATEAWAR